MERYTNMKTRLTAALFCCAAVLGAQTAKTVLGTVTEFKANSFEMGVKSDAGEALFFPFGTDTEVVQIPPGERDLGKATSGVGHRHSGGRSRDGELRGRHGGSAAHRPDLVARYRQTQ